MPSGWTRWILEQFEFPFEVVYPQRLDAGNLNAQFDVLVFVDGAIPRAGRRRSGRIRRRRWGGGGAAINPICPAEYRAMTGRVTVDKTVPQLKAFLESGGRIVAIGGSTSLARHLGLPIENHLVERTPEGEVRPIPREKFYVPASLLEVSVNTGATSALGMGTNGDRNVRRESGDGASSPTPGRTGITPVAWFATGLRSRADGPGDRPT